MENNISNAWLYWVILQKSTFSSSSFLTFLQRLLIGISAGIGVVLIAVENSIMRRWLGNGVLLHVLPASGRPLAVADTTLDIGDLFISQLFVSRDKPLTPERKFFCQFAREVKVETYGSEGIDSVAHFAPVRWSHIVANMVADGMTEAEELGPGKVLQGLIAKTSRDIVLSGRQWYARPARSIEFRV